MARRNAIWQQLVPISREVSRRLADVQSYMLAHQHEDTLTTLDRSFVRSIDNCISAFEQMTKLLKQLKSTVINNK